MSSRQLADLDIWREDRSEKKHGYLVNKCWKTRRVFAWSPETPTFNDWGNKARELRPKWETRKNKKQKNRVFGDGRHRHCLVLPKRSSRMRTETSPQAHKSTSPQACFNLYSFFFLLQQVRERNCYIFPPIFLYFMSSLLICWFILKYFGWKCFSRNTLKGSSALAPSCSLL